MHKGCCCLCCCLRVAADMSLLGAVFILSNIGVVSDGQLPLLTRNETYGCVSQLTRGRGLRCASCGRRGFSCVHVGQHQTLML